MNEQRDRVREKLEECLRECDTDGRATLRGDFGGADLSGWKYQQWPGKVDFAGNFAGAKFVGTMLPFMESDDIDLSLEVRWDGERTHLVLSGTFAGADFGGATLIGVDLCGDFTGGNFRGARLVSCQLRGKFDRTDLGATLYDCNTLPAVKFKGADLSRTIGLECAPGQISRSQIGPNAQILVRRGDTLTVAGRDYPLLRPINRSESEAVQKFSHCVLSKDARNASFSRIVQLIGGTIQVEEDPDWDSLTLGLDAKDLNLTALPASLVHLWGRYRRVAILESPRTETLELSTGSFHELDLSQTRLRTLVIALASVQIGKINLPNSLRTVDVSHRFLFGPKQGTASLEKMSPTEIEMALQAWTCKAKRAQVAGRLLASVPRLSHQRKQDILNSSSEFVPVVLHRKSPANGALAMAALLIARTNADKNTRAFLARQKSAQ